MKTKRAGKADLKTKTENFASKDVKDSIFVQKNETPLSIATRDEQECQDTLNYLHNLKIDFSNVKEDEEDLFGESGSDESLFDELNNLPAGDQTNQFSDAKSIIFSAEKTYQERAIKTASEITGINISSFEEAKFIIAGKAKETGLLSLDIVDAMDNFDCLIERHRNIDLAALDSALRLGENIVLFGVENSALETVDRLSSEQGIEIVFVDAATSTDLDLEKGLGEFPINNTDIKIVAIKNLSVAKDDTKKIISEAVLNRRIGNSVVAGNVRIVFIENKNFNSHDIPGAVLLKSICLMVDSFGSSPVNEVVDVLNSRKTRLENQLKEAKLSGNKEKELKLENLLKKTGFAGALSENDITNHKTKLDELKVILETLTAKPSISKGEKAATILDIIGPEKSKFRELVASKLIKGIGGCGFAERALENYFSKNTGPLVGLPMIADVLAGITSVNEVVQLIKSNHKAYITYVALELRTSFLVDFAMKNNEREGEILSIIFASIASTDPEVALGIAAERPYFLKV